MAVVLSGRSPPSFPPLLIPSPHLVTKKIVRVGVVGLACVSAAWWAVGELIGPPSGPRYPASGPGTAHAARPPGLAPASPAPRPAPSVVLFSQGFLDDSGYNLAYPYTAPIRDRGSLAECLAAVKGRADRGIADLKGVLERRGPSSGTLQDAVEVSRLETFVALLSMYDGRFAEADPWIARAIATARAPGVPPELAANLVALRGVNALRRGELDNCVACIGPSSCIFPIAPEAVHLNPSGSRAAFGYFSESLRRRPEDLGVRWLLNIAAMTLGTYPDAVPARFRVAEESSHAATGVGRFRNVASASGLNARGPNMSGGSLFDDFDGDGRPDVLTTSTDWDFGAALHINKGDGTFEDRSVASGLDAQPMALNLAHADYDNDGRPDVLIVRGGWEDPYPLALMHNLGGGKFEDVAVASGLGVPIASKSAAWGDFDNDGRVDLYIAGEYCAVSDIRVGEANPAPRRIDPRNRSRLYRNNGDGTFTDVAERAGVLNERWAQGAAWGDYDGDGRADLFVSNLGAHCRLYRNRGDGTFEDVAPSLGVTGPHLSFACWFWDYDNDGRLDIYVNASFSATQDVIADALRKPAPGGARPRLYRNLGPEGFRDVAAEVGLDRVWLPMGANCADVDNDGYLDIYLATGRPQYSALVPNVMLRNVAGRRFDDVTTASGTGHLQKGHGVSFADYDADGDLDLFVQTGGATPGDRAHNLLFQNPGGGGHWLEVKLVGTRSNRSALGAKVRADLPATPGHPARSVYRQIGPGSSFGGNRLTAWLGLGDAARVAALTVEWPATGARQTLPDLAADRSIEIIEEAPRD